MISEKYKQAYGAMPVVEEELTGWEEVQVWPET